MSANLFNIKRIKTLPLSQRISKMHISAMIDPDSKPIVLDQKNQQDLETVVKSIKQAKNNQSPIILATGAHLIKNGGSRILIRLMEQGYISHIITNSAGSIHDWELAYQGQTAEDVQKYVSVGQFGIWEETQKYLNLAIIYGSRSNFGYGESIGKMILEDKVTDQNRQQIKIKHKYPEISVQAQAYRLKVQFGVMASIGQDIIYCSQYANGSAIGSASLKDFLDFTNSVSKLEGGVYISIGSSIMSPMVFEKALSMARNINEENKPQNFLIVANDIQPKLTDWDKGEPQQNNPNYYNRIFKTFSRMGGNFMYFELDNIAFMHNLYALLRGT